VTPFLAMAENLAANPAGSPQVTVVVGVDHLEQAFYLDRLRQHESRCPSLTVIAWVREQDGMPTGAALARRIPDLADRVVLLSGPEQMVAELTRGLRTAGVRRGRIHAEIAVGPPRRWRYAPPVLRVMRWLISAELSVFAGAVIASMITQGP
jgi:ferredoxin-NADP reductase